MDAKRFEEIKDLIKRTEIESAKSQGLLDSIKKKWKADFGTDNVEEIKGKLKEMESELEKSNARLDALHDKLEESYDWDKLAEELG